jgi:hypothetical protein
MFPRDQIADTKYLPLTVLDFIQRVLVPETALQLIMIDMNCDMEKGVKVLRESGTYGEQMFPELEDDPVREAIVDRRVKKRRHEIELEEAELWPEVDNELESAATPPFPSSSVSSSAEQTRTSSRL